MTIFDEVTISGVQKVTALVDSGADVTVIALGMCNDVLGQGEDVTFVEESGWMNLITFGGEEVHVNRVAIL